MAQRDDDGLLRNGWDDNAVVDVAGVSLLGLWLCDDPKHRFLPSIRAVDKYPSLDGSIFFGERNASGKIRLDGIAEVQIKSTTVSLVNDNKRGTFSDYKFSCDTAVFAAVQNQVSKNPIVLVVADVTNKRLYRKILTRDYITSLNLRPNARTKTIYFDECDALEDHDRFFAELKSGSEASMAEYDLAANHSLVCPDDISKGDLRLLIKEVDRLNLRCDTDLYFLKKWSFKDAWKVGLLYHEQGDRYVLALAAMSYGNGELVLLRPLSVSDESDPNSYFKHIPLGPNMNGDAHFAVTLSKGEPFSEAVEKLIEIWCKSFTETWFVPPAAMSNELICELAYHYLDLLAKWVPSLGDEEYFGRFSVGDLSALDFERYVDALYYAYEQFLLKLQRAMHAEKDRNSVYVFDAPKRRDAVPKWLSDSVVEFLARKNHYESHSNIIIRCDKISIAYVKALAEEACSRHMRLSRLWKLSPMRLVEERRDAQVKKYGWSLRRFDLLLTKDDYVSNFKRYASVLGPTLNRAASVFFGDNSPNPVSAKKTTVALYIDKDEAVCKKISHRSDSESYELEGVFDLGKYKPFTADEMQAADKLSSPVTFSVGGKLHFVDEIPLYCALEDYLAEGIKSVVSEKAVRISRIHSERKRKAAMGYTILRR